MTSRKLFVPFVVLAAGCAARAPRDLPLDHPANPAAPEVEFLPPPNILGTEEKPPAPSQTGGPQGAHEAHSHHDHGAQASKLEEKGLDGYPLSVCVVSGEPLGSMGKPVVVRHEGREVRFCCKACVETFHKDPWKYLAKLDAAEKERGTSSGHAAAPDPSSDHPALAPKPQEHADRLLAAYLGVTDALAQDKYEEARRGMAELRDSAATLASGQDPKLAPPAKNVALATPEKFDGIEGLRKVLIEVTPQVLDLVRVAPPTTRVAPALYQAYCPMAKASWLQKSSEVANPYFGSKMLRCGKVTQTIPAVDAARP